MKEYDFEKRGTNQLAPEYVTERVKAGWEIHTIQYYPAEDCREGVRVAFYHVTWVRKYLYQGW